MDKPQVVYDTLHVLKTYHFIKYDYSGGFGYLSEYIQGAVVKPDREIEISEYLKTYNSGSDLLAKRKNGRRIFGNRFVLRSTHNRYETEFWKNKLDWSKFRYDFEILGNLKISDN